MEPSPSKHCLSGEEWAGQGVLAAVGAVARATPSRDRRGRVRGHHPPRGAGLPPDPKTQERAPRPSLVSQGGQGSGRREGSPQSKPEKRTKTRKRGGSGRNITKPGEEMQDGHTGRKLQQEATAGTLSSRHRRAVEVRYIITCVRCMKQGAGADRPGRGERSGVLRRAAMNQQPRVGPAHACAEPVGPPRATCHHVPSAHFRSRQAEAPVVP